MSTPRYTVSVLFSVIFVALTVQAQVPSQNVNMVSGTKWPGGDPFLQRQNEPSLAVSTRNPMHLLAGANDYRTVDLNLVDQLPIDELSGDAWLGVFKSFDGGRTWKSTLLPGFPQDASSFGAASPMKGFSAASDPLVRSGTNGMFYYSGIAFNRSNNLGGLFVARFVDLNNRENGDASQPNYPAPSTDPLRYINTVQLDSGTAGQFIDKPWMAVDIPRAGSGMCNISVQQANGTTVTQSFPAGNIYVAYPMFVGGQVNVRSKINFTTSSDCGATWTKPVIISQTYATNQGPAVAVDPETGYVYVAWRVFQGASNPDAIVVAKSTDGGNTFSKGATVISLAPYSSANPVTTPAFFDQGTSATSFRTSAVPTIAVDDSGAANVPGHVYVAWSQRGMGPNGDARIMISTSPDGVAWTGPMPVDNGAVTDDSSGSFTRGHQIMPAVTFNQGKLMLVYYDLRLDHTVGYFSPNTLLGVFTNGVCSNSSQGVNAFVPDCLGRFYLEERDYVGDPASAVFGPYIADAGLTVRRHTMDVMLAQSNGGASPTFTTARVSRYDFGLPSDKAALEQLKVNPPNLPMFSQGAVPFMGDYLDIAGQPFVPVPGSNAWAYNNPNNSALAGQPAPSPVHFASWTSNQDVVPPADGNWTKYIPITNGTSIYNGTTTQLCTPGVNNGWEGDRNQNIYESRITQGLLVGSPQNSKPLSTTVQRAFVILVQNFTNFQRTFQLSIANQPPGNFAIAGQSATGGYASFQQAVPNQPALPKPLPAPVTAQSVTIPPHSGAAATIFALSSLPTASITVNVNETDASNKVLANGLSSFIVLNADGTVPPLADPDAAPASIAGVELYTPNITTPNITTPNITTPNITTPNITTPNITTPNITTPNITTPNITTPNITTTTVSNPNITTPNITTPNITTTPVSDATNTFTNTGNTSAQYHVRVVGNTSTPLQLIASQIYTTPTSINCELIPQQQNITLANAANVTTTDLAQVGNPNITTPGTDVTIEVAPGDTAYITLRGDVDIPTMQQIVAQVAPVILPQAVNTNSTATTPTFAAPLFIVTATLPDAVVGSSYTVPLQTIGGIQPFTWNVETGALPPGFALDPVTGTISNSSPNANVVGRYAFTVKVTDSQGAQASKTLSIAVSPGETLVNIPVAAGGDLISRGFYLPSYPGIALTTAYLYLGADTAGTYTFTLTARSGGYGGTLLGTASATANLSGGRSNLVPIAFNFSPSLSTVEGTTVAFAINEVSGPGAATQVFYSVGSCGLGDRTCSVPGPQVIETEGTTPPLDTFRRNGVSLLLIEGTISASVSGAVRLIPPPASVQLGALESNTTLFLFAERTTYSLPQSVPVDISTPGTYTTLPLSPSTINAGSLVDVYYLHHDQIGFNGGTAPGQNLQGSITFDTDVIGIIALDPTLVATNGILGAPGTLYDNFPNGQGYEFTPPCPGLQDSVTLSSDRRTLTVCTTVYGANDDLRIITATGAATQAQTFTVRHSFTNSPDGAFPFGGLLRDAATGNLYGTTLSGGCTSYGCGTVFKLDPASNETVLYRFGSVPSGLDPQDPYAAPVMDAAGNLYGTTRDSGAFGGGTVFRLDTSGNLTVLYSFNPAGADGALPYAGLVLDAGNLYGTATPSVLAPYGTVFKIDTAGNFTVLHTFTSSPGDGADPFDALIIAAGNLYGTASAGGAFGFGTVFKLNITSGAETVLYSFKGGSDGANPIAGLLMDAAGNLYGTTVVGGSGTSATCSSQTGVGGCGTVFKLDTSGNETVLHSFTGYPSDGALPYAGLVMDAAGNLYGTTSEGGSGLCTGRNQVVVGCGTVFKLDPAGNETVLYPFTGGSDGAFPLYGHLEMDTAGNLYGTASSFLALGGFGTVFKLTVQTPPAPTITP